jgi:predicted transcriptional regulator
MIDFACKTFKLEDVIKCGLGLTKADLKIFKFLIKLNAEATSEEISKKNHLDLSTVQRTVKKLYEKKILFRHQTNLDGGGYIFSYKTKSKKAITLILNEIITKWQERVENELNNW